MLQLYANNAATYLVSPLTIGGGVLSVSSTDATLFPIPTVGAEFFLITLENINTKAYEIVMVTQVSGGTFSVVRAQEGTSAQAFPTGSKVQLRVTKGTLELLRSAATSAKSTTVHTQTTAASVWNIVHNENRYPSVSLQVGAYDGTSWSGLTYAEADITYTDSSAIIINFSENVKGKAYLN